MQTKDRRGTLFLTPSEQKHLRLGEMLERQWNIETEVGTAEDSEKDRVIRMTFLSVQDPSLQHVARLARNGASPAQLLASILRLSLADLPEADLAELFFALGPSSMTAFIALLLRQDPTAETVPAVALIAAVRHTYFASYARR